MLLTYLFFFIKINRGETRRHDFHRRATDVVLKDI